MDTVGLREVQTKKRARIFPLTRYGLFWTAVLWLAAVIFYWMFALVMDAQAAESCQLPTGVPQNAYRADDPTQLCLTYGCTLTRIVSDASYVIAACHSKIPRGRGFACGEGAFVVLTLDDWTAMCVEFRHRDAYISRMRRQEAQRLAAIVRLLERAQAQRKAR